MNDERKFKEELNRLGYKRVLTIKYCGISFVGGVHDIYLHEKGVLLYVDFETGEFGVNESFGKNPAKAAKEDALAKEVKRAQLIVVLSSAEEVDKIKYLSTKFDYDRTDDHLVRALFTFDDYDNRNENRERNNTRDDLFHVLSDVLTLDLKKHPSKMSYHEQVFCTPPECWMFADEEKADAAFKDRIKTIKNENPDFFAVTEEKCEPKQKKAKNQ
jgi:hypothetical protein